MSKTDAETKFNRNFKYLRYISDVTMVVLAELISEHFIGKALSIQQIQSYELSSEPKNKVLLAIRDYYKIKDSSFTCDMLLERDFENEKYRFSEVNNQEESKENNVINE